MKTGWETLSPRPLDVICMGRVAVDLYAEQIGVRLQDVASFKKYLGGCAGNIAVGSSRAGLKSAMFSCVGSDAMGQFLKEELTREKVDISHVRETPSHLTGLVLLGVEPPDHFPLIFYRENCADMQLEISDIDEAYLAASKALLITGTGLSTERMRLVTHAAVASAHAVKTRVILDLDYRPVLWKLTAAGDGETRYKISDRVSAHYQEILANCDLIVGTVEEIQIAGHADELQSALNNIRKLSRAPIVCKLGADGCKIYLDDLTNPVMGAPYPATVLNVLGAGDAFISGFMRGLLYGENWETCASYGNAGGAIVVGRHGCAPAMPYFDEMLSFIASRQISHKGIENVRVFDTQS